MRSPATRRIEDVQMLKSRQFREDAGPLAHPVRPESFVEINNFYTATVYEKGAEVIRMLRLLVGHAAYDAAVQLYFDRHDGQACTIEDWLQVFTDTSGRDLAQFKRWYSQAGTPQVTVAEQFENGTYTLTLTQNTKPTPGQDDKQPLLIPVELGLLSSDGTELVASHVVELDSATQSYCYKNLPERPIASLFRGLSAPVVVHHDLSDTALLTLMRHDTDAYNRWDAGRILARKALTNNVLTGGKFPADIIAALMDTANDSRLDPAFRALCLGLPSQDDIAQTLFQSGHAPDPAVIYQSRNAMLDQIAAAGASHWRGLYDDHQTPGPYTTDAAACGKRALANAAMAMITRLDGGDLAQTQYDGASNMTNQLAALGQLVRSGRGANALAAFYDQWRHEPLVIDKWFSLQITQSPPDVAVGLAHDLATHPDFTLRNPNRFRALVAGFASTPAAFHHPSGAGYDFVAQKLIELDALNPQLTARVSTVFETWPRYGAGLQAKMKAALTRIADQPTLSRDTREMVTRLLQA